MYQSLYRKYRPQTFDEVVGQNVIIKILKNEIIKNKITHAYLFTGPRGTGKTSIAQILAKTVNCNKLNNIQPCNKCVSCTQIKQKQSVDVVEIDAASNNGVDEIRELKSKVSLVPSTSKYKIYIIDEVHMLTIGAFNALLKTLEEPPSHIIFILATTEPHKIPETILSRCQKFDFKKIDNKSMYERLNYICQNEKIEIEDGALNEIIRFSSGGMRDAINLLEQASVYSEGKIAIKDVHEINGTFPQHQLKELIDSIIIKDLNKIFNLLEEYDNKGKNFIKLVEEIILFFKNIIIYKNIPDFLNNDISQEIYDSEILKLSNKEIFKIISNINDCLIEMKNYNNPKLVFELLMVSLVSTNKKENDVKEPLEKIESKENKMQSLKTEMNSISKGTSDIVSNRKSEKIENFKNINNKDKTIEQIKKIRVNNTFVKPSKAILNQVKNDIELSRKYLIDEKYGKIASLLLDSKITAANLNNIIFVFPSDGMTKTFNNNILRIEEFLFEILKTNYKIIALNQEEWKEYRSEYKSKIKNYVYEKETILMQEYLNKQIESDKPSDEIHTLFSDIIEYKK